jgi:hypothetical protein
LEDSLVSKRFNIREHFLTKLYALAGFRKVRSEGKVSGLIQFHEAIINYGSPQEQVARMQQYNEKK